MTDGWTVQTSGSHSNHRQFGRPGLASSKQHWTDPLDRQEHYAALIVVNVGRLLSDVMESLAVFGSVVRRQDNTEECRASDLFLRRFGVVLLDRLDQRFRLHSRCGKPPDLLRNPFNFTLSLFGHYSLPALDEVSVRPPGQSFVTAKLPPLGA